MGFGDSDDLDGGLGAVRALGGVADLGTNGLEASCDLLY
jgi:hypothetical protein